MSSTVDHADRPERSRLVASVGVQLNVVGALIMRELHTRYGRDNIGYLWIFAEPMTLAVAVAIIHAGKKAAASSVSTVAIAICGYMAFMLFRSIVLRAESMLDGNRPLLYHRMVTLLDLLLARSLLEAASTLLAFVLLMAGAIALGYADLPARPLILVLAILLVTWFSFAVSMIVCVASHFSALFSRLIHPAIYIALPISGAFFLMKWIPLKFQPYFTWFPLVQMQELVRYGQFRELDARFVQPAYLILVCLALTLVGLVSLRLLRPHVQLE